MKPEGWRGKTPQGRQVIYTCHERSPKLADITAKVDGEEDFHVQLDVPLPINREDVEMLFAVELANTERSEKEKR